MGNYIQSNMSLGLRSPFLLSYLPILVGGDVAEKLLDLLVVRHSLGTVVLLQVFDRLVVRQHVPSATAQLQHILSCLHNYFG